MKRLTMTLALAAALTACGKKKEAAPAAGSGSAVVSTTADAAPVDPVAPDAAEAAAATIEVPTEADFEEDIAAKVTDKTLDSDLTALEKELGN